MKVVKLSCKISSALIESLENSGEDLTWIFEQSSIPMEILGDPSSWIFAHEMETFLSSVQKAYSSKGIRIDFQSIGHQSAELKAWGILDHVLRMMPKPYEIFYHPESFIAYFVSPKPPVENFRKRDSGVEFDWPLLPDQFPFVSEYLKAAFEAIPTFVGQPLAQCHWEHIHVAIKWTESQKPLFTQQEGGHQVSPDLFNSVIQELQKQQQSLEERNQKLQRQNEELHRRLFQGRQMTRKEYGMGDLELLDIEEPNEVQLAQEFQQQKFSEERYRILSQNMAKLNDYMYRAQQVITILAAAKSPTPQHVAKHVLIKVDWEHIRKQFPFLLQEYFTILKSFDQNQQSENNRREALMNPEFSEMKEM